MCDSDIRTQLWPYKAVEKKNIKAIFFMQYPKNKKKYHPLKVYDLNSTSFPQSQIYAFQSQKRKKNSENAFNANFTGDDSGTAGLSSRR